MKFSINNGTFVKNNSKSYVQSNVCAWRETHNWGITMYIDMYNTYTHADMRTHDIHTLCMTAPPGGHRNSNSWVDKGSRNKAAFLGESWTMLLLFVCLFTWRQRLEPLKWKPLENGFQGEAFRKLSDFSSHWKLWKNATFLNNCYCQGKGKTFLKTKCKIDAFSLETLSCNRGLNFFLI